MSDPLYEPLDFTNWPFRFDKNYKGYQYNWYKLNLYQTYRSLYGNKGIIPWEPFRLSTSHYLFSLKSEFMFSSSIEAYLL